MVDINKGVSTPIAITIILIFAILVGVFTFWQYSEIRKEEIGTGKIELPQGVRFMVFKPRQGEPQRVTVYNVSLPLDRGEVINVFKKVIGENPSCSEDGQAIECPIEKVEKGWEITYGLYLDTFFRIDEEEKTVRIREGF